MSQIIQFVVKFTNNNRSLALFVQDSLDELLNCADFDFFLNLAMQLLLGGCG